MNKIISLDLLKNLILVFFGALSQPIIAFSYTLLKIDSKNIDMAISIIFKEVLPLIGIGIIFSGISYIGKSYLANNALNNLRKNLFSCILSIPLDKFYNKDSGEYYNLLLKKVELWKERTYNQIFNIIQYSLEIFCLFFLLFKISFIGGIVSMIFLLPLILNNLIFPKKINKMYSIYLKKYDTLITSTKEYLNGFEIIKTNNLNNNFIKKFNKTSTYINKEEKKIDLICNLSGVVANSCVILSQISGILISLLLYIKRVISFGELLALIQIVFFLNEPTIRLINSVISLQSNKFVNDELKEFLKIKEKNTLKDEPFHSLTFSNVSYQYKEKSSPTINNFNKTFLKNKKYLITGKSGSGKTTLFHLIIGKLIPTKGSILINSNPTTNGLVNDFFIVAQNNFIFTDTVKNNVDLFNNHTEEAVLEVLKKVHLIDLVNSKKEKLNSIINEEVSKISGGERARIGLARAILSDANIILIDEVLASLDPKIAVDIEKLILEIKDKTIIHISHKSNLDLIKKYDELIEI